MQSGWVPVEVGLALLMTGLTHPLHFHRPKEMETFWH